MDATAGTVVVGSVGDGDADNFYSAANTADLEVLAQTLITGEWVWSLVGIKGA